LSSDTLKKAPVYIHSSRGDWTVTWLLVQFKKPRGLALLRALSQYGASIGELYVRRVGYRSNLYAIKANTRLTTAEKLLEDLGRWAKVELVAIADSLTLREGWERVEFVTREVRHREMPALKTKMAYIRVGGREVPIAKPKSWEPVEPAGRGS